MCGNPSIKSFLNSFKRAFSFLYLDSKWKRNKREVGEQIFQSLLISSQNRKILNVVPLVSY